MILAISGRGQHSLECLKSVRKDFDALSLIIVCDVGRFRSRPTFAGVPEKYKERLAALIPTDLPLHVSAPLIDMDVYWKRCVSDLFQNVGFTLTPSISHSSSSSFSPCMYAFLRACTYASCAGACMCVWASVGVRACMRACERVRDHGTVSITESLTQL